MYGMELPEDDELSYNGSLMVVCGMAKGKTAHLKVSLRSAKKAAAARGHPASLYNFDLHKFDFPTQTTCVQIVASHSHSGLHLAFNQGHDVISIYDYTATFIPKKERPEQSFYFPETIKYASEAKELLVGQLSVPGEKIKVI